MYFLLVPLAGPSRIDSETGSSQSDNDSQSTGTSSGTNHDSEPSDTESDSTPAVPVGQCKIQEGSWEAVIYDTNWYPGKATEDYGIHIT